MTSVRQKRKRTGRPPLPPGRQFNVRIPMPEAERIRSFSDETGLTYTDIVSKLVIDHIDEVKHENFGVTPIQPAFDDLEALQKTG